MFLGSIRHLRLPYQALEDFELLHVSIAFLLCYLWLHAQRFAGLAAILASGVFALSGFMMLQLQHMGLICGYTWLPLALWGVDDARRERSFRPLWKLVAASALCFLAGYPPFWFVFAVVTTVYAAAGHWRLRCTLGTIVALFLSLLISMVQLWPAMQASGLKEPQEAYGIGIRDPAFFLSYFLPNFYDFGIGVDIHTNPGREYLYLGIPAIFAILNVAAFRRLREMLPALSVLAVSFILLTNPFGLILAGLKHSHLLIQICRSWYFLAGITLAMAPLTAIAIDDFLGRTARRKAPLWIAAAAVMALAAWSVHQFRTWLPDGSGFAAGWRSAIEPAITLALFALAIYVLRASEGHARLALTASIILAIGVDYKVFGTDKRVNATKDAVVSYDKHPFSYVDEVPYQQMHAHPDYRVVVDYTDATDLHHSQLTTPQGDDPMLTKDYKNLMLTQAQYKPVWDFTIDPARRDALRLLGVRYFLLPDSSPLYPRLVAASAFHLMTPSQEYFKVFEYEDARPAYDWNAGDARMIVWRPERRIFEVSSQTGGWFHLSEQNFPGWSASVDGKSTPVHIWRTAFQQVQVPPGAHRVEFRFRSLALVAGAVVSLISLIGTILGLSFALPARSRGADALGPLAHPKPRSCE